MAVLTRSKFYNGRLHLLPVNLSLGNEAVIMWLLVYSCQRHKRWPHSACSAGGGSTSMGQPLKKDTDQFIWPTSDAIREASRKVSRTIDNLTDRLSREIGQEVDKEEADKAAASE